ncbi:TVP38/TMEM64 family protein [Paenibacillus barcinonensis]|uniref:TVP38/TMEM64 family membrane protein n=1 Tax=Paenibacillus barcinonensis TaxID=198119 RepID=A0A2V4V5R6_PAEBA|nr:TVP38/TMEM64 family protein [Paenibacillus barcinonensis]PYE47633.1 putative membrane protein YdjX (TVP38/TMEM64 family) [Paenibacillus barcinonensis]QKS58507.1 TVP38/TMEM64 family protein [Paenibacillus barcinonensis]
MKPYSKHIVVKILLGLITALSLGLLLYYAADIIKIMSSMDNFRAYIHSTGHWGPVMFILFQVLQIVVAPIPGEIVQVAGGYIYGAALGSFYTTVGLILGSAIAFYFTRFIGRDFVSRLLQKQNVKWMSFMQDERKFSIFLFIFFVVPGLPKDMLVFVAALTSISSLRFFTILLVGRLPWIIGSAAVGSTIQTQQYTVAIIISVIAVIGFVLGYIYKDKLINLFSRAEHANKTPKMEEIIEAVETKEAKENKETNKVISAVKAKAAPALNKSRDIATVKNKG